MFAKKKRKKSRSSSFLDVQTQRHDPPKPVSENISIAFLMLLALALLLWLGFAGIRGLAKNAYTSNERYTMVAGHIEFQTSPNGLLNATRTMDIAGIDPAGNLFDFDIKQARKRLLEMPAIKEAVLKRNLPDGLEIRLEERNGVAQIPARVPLLVDKDGLVIRSAITSKDRSLPIIRGIKTPNAKTGLNISTSNGNDGLQILNTIRESPFLPRFLKVKEIAVNDAERVEMVLHNDTRILLPRTRFEANLNRTAQFLDEGPKNRKLNVIDFTSGKLFVRHE